MRVEALALPGVLLITPTVFADVRGAFFESWNAELFAAAGVAAAFVQDNHSVSGPRVLRGLHYQRARPQGKLVRVVAGAVVDVVVDLRRSSAGFGRALGVRLDAMERTMLWVPEGFAHGFRALSEGAEVLYKVTAPYDPADEHVLAWDDPACVAAWGGLATPVLSARDAAGGRLGDLPHFA